MPSYIGNLSNHTTGGPVSSLSLSYAPTLGNLVLLFITVNGNGNTVSVEDSAGLDVFNNPLNTWELLGNINVNGLRTELWCCPKVLAALTSVSVIFSELNSEVSYSLIEYSSAAVEAVGSNSNSGGYSNLFFNGTATNNSAVMVVGFVCQDFYPQVGSGTPWQPHIPPHPITPAVQRGNTGELLEVQEQAVIVAETLTAEAITNSNNPSALGFAALGVVLTGGITLSLPPGFADVDSTKLVAGDVLNALVLNQINMNGTLGMVRPEFFYSVQLDGSTVPLPVSPIDGYNYVADELIYIYTPLTTFDSTTGWVSADGVLFYVQWDVDQVTGLVTCQEYYHPDGNKPVNKTSDGQLIVLTVGQRAKGGIDMSFQPSLFELPFASFAQDKATTQTMMQALAESSKFAAVKAEVMCMGEFVNGQTVPTPVSPEDGYVYGYDEVKFLSSWKWTTYPTSFGPPPMASANGGNSDGGWSQLNQIQSSVSAVGLVNCQVFFQNHGAIDPSTAPNGSTAYGRLVVFAFCERRKGPNFSIPTMGGFAILSGTNTIFAKVAAQLGTATGKLAITLQAAPNVAGPSSTVVTKAVIKRTLAGSTAVVDTTNILFSGVAGVTIPKGSQVTSDVLTSWTFDKDHDYYIAVLVDATGSSVATSFLNTGNVTVKTPQYVVIAGDQTGVTTAPTIANWNSGLLLISAIVFNLVDGVLADNFREIPITSFTPGNPLLASTLKQLSNNVQEGCYAVEFFGPTNHVNGDTISLPTSPTDGYSYSRSELFYIWNWHDTGTAATRLFGLGAVISAAGVVSTVVWHCPQGGPPTPYGSATLAGCTPHAADGSIDVMVIATRTRFNPSQSSSNALPPSDIAVLGYGGSGGFIIGS